MAPSTISRFPLGSAAAASEASRGRLQPEVKRVRLTYGPHSLFGGHGFSGVRLMPGTGQAFLPSLNEE